MNRKLTFAMLLSLCAASPVALGLGLGEADVRSTLNAPLRASIPLTDAGGIQPDLLNVTLADERAYAAAGLSRTPLAASVRLEVERRQGQLVVDMTTERPVREPWLDLLLRFDWPSGQQVREVTLLLDPPDYDEMPALVSASPRVAEPDASPSQREARPTEATRTPSSDGGSGDGDAAWVSNGDTLWAVAGRLRPDSDISMNQMMVALVAANPEVFPSGNINAMRAGFTLAVPDRETIAARSQAEADRIVGAMNQAWANRGGGAPARVPLVAGETAAAVASSPAQGSGQEVAVGDDAAPEEASASDEGDAGESDEAASPRESGAAAGENAPEPRLTLLTDAEVAAEQSLPGDGAEASGGAEGEEGGGNDAPRVTVDPDLLETLFGEGTVGEDERLLRLESRWQQSEEELEAVQEERDVLRDELDDMRDELAELRDQIARLGAGADGAEGPGAGGLATPAEQDEEAPWWGALFPAEVDRNLMLGGAGLAALLALWLVVRMRRRREEAAPTPAGQVRVATPGAPAPGYATAVPGGSAEEAPSERSVRASLPQAEAINEADIFIAYGRYDQARELLEASLAREPERDDLRLKLLGVHLEQGRREAAERELARLREGGNPAVIEEAEALMARHALPAEPEERPAPVSSGERAHFVEAAVLPPRRFDEAADERADAPGGDAEVPRPPATEEVPPTAPSEATSPYRRPEASYEALTREPGAPEGEPAPAPVSPVEPAPDTPDPAEPPAAESPAAEPPATERPPAEAPLAPEEEAPLPEVPTRQRDDGTEVIDYRPPSLETPGAPREETPMQPSVDFTPEGLGLAEKGAGFDPGKSLTRADAEPGSAGEEGAQQGAAADEPLSEAWEVEEVSFPPLDPDNGKLAGGGESDRLAEAHRLVEGGEAGRARELLDELAGSDDPAIRDEALVLRRRLDA